LEQERRGRLARGGIRVGFGSFAGLVGLYEIYQAVFLFSWNRPFGHLMIATMGVVFILGGLEMPGLSLFFPRFYDPYALCELKISDDNIVSESEGKTRQFPWIPSRGFRENEKFLYVRALKDEANWVIPKRSVTQEQELSLRELIRRT